MAGKLGKAVVTGASSGIGAVYADRLGARGYDLVLVARRADRLEKLASAIKAKHSVQVEVLAADLGKASDLETMATRLRVDEEITLLVNNAGLAHTAPAVQLSPEKAQEQIAVNITALVQLSLAMLPGFVARNAGTLINISSVLSIFSLPNMAAYSATKAFVMLFTRGLQEELKETHVRVQAVLPASTATEIWDQIGGHSVLDPATVMTTEDCVDAALAGLDAGEQVTLPSLEEVGLWEQFDKNRSALVPAVNKGSVGSRYNLSR